MNDSMAPSSADLQRCANLADDYPESFVALEGRALWLESAGARKTLAVLAPAEDPILQRFHGTGEPFDAQRVLLRCPTTDTNAAALRMALPWLMPVPLGLTTSAGCGDRLGLATPGHVRAFRQALDGPSTLQIAPIFAQQSVREMTRTGRTPLDVLDDATWGAFQAGWREPLGADADHLKTIDDVTARAATGYSFFTIDPSDYVDDDANRASRPNVERKLGALPWKELESDPVDLRRRYAGRTFALDDRAIVMTEAALMRAAAKYGSAVAHVTRLYRRLAAAAIAFEMEISVDETETPTSPCEHLYLVGELRRLGVQWVSFAPRFVGTFEKGIDFVGDIDRLRSDLEVHAAIARTCGPYKLSLHSGSDKFSVYQFLQAATNGLVHLKTAGTSYLEALRVVSQVDPGFFREITECARSHYTMDRASYHVSAELDGLPEAAALSAASLPFLLEDASARQILHVTFGSVLARFQAPLLHLLRTHEELYARTLESHLFRHLAPFARPEYVSDGKS